MAVSIASAIVGHLVTRLESLTQDDPSVAPGLAHNPTWEGADSPHLETLYRNFRVLYPTAVEATPTHLGTREYHPRLWRLPLVLEVVYPYGDPRNRNTIAGVALDDATRIIHHLEVDHTRVSVAGTYEWSGVLVEHTGLEELEGGILSTFQVTAIYQRVFD